ncbi:hypothetical protein C4561_01425 [candidate division WWE3 bacterium]|uniref:Uncharacterized protein n=1 Tax=candidate division WWE3 bacterium TaxID=2053526 RepID=A0A3A4ZF30_UNCKA|nr:MAG: hypothetical protein C4561_01425 [candidate division WWE3 bacterium]
MTKTYCDWCGKENTGVGYIIRVDGTCFNENLRISINGITEPSIIRLCDLHEHCYKKLVTRLKAAVKKEER